MICACRNCGGPLLITASSDEVSLEDLDPLDATRITPVLYLHAKGLARAIVDPGAEEDAGKHHVREAQSRPNDVEGFHLLVRPCGSNVGITKEVLNLNVQQAVRGRVQPASEALWAHPV